jgi:hypothetical protein
MSPGGKELSPGVKTCCYVLLEDGWSEGRLARQRSANKKKTIRSIGGDGGMGRDFDNYDGYSELGAYEEAFYDGDSWLDRMNPDSGSGDHSTETSIGRRPRRKPSEADIDSWCAAWLRVDDATAGAIRCAVDRDPRLASKDPARLASRLRVEERLIAWYLEDRPRILEWRRTGCRPNTPAEAKARTATKREVPAREAAHVAQREREAPGARLKALDALRCSSCGVVVDAEGHCLCS